MVKKPQRYQSHPRKVIHISLLASLVFILSIGCSFSNPLALFFPTSTNTLTMTYTPTSTSTSTSTFTATATATQTFTPVPPRFDIQTQADDSNLVMDLLCGYQFVLPRGWTPAATFFDVSDITSFNRVAENLLVYPSLKMSIRSFEREMATLDLELYHYTAGILGPMDKALSQVLTTNVYGTALGTLKISNMTAGFRYEAGDEVANDSMLFPGTSKNKNRIRPLVGPGYYQTYEILFYCEEQVINIKFSGSSGKGYELSSKEMQFIYTIQNSIRYK